MNENYEEVLRPLAIGIIVLIVLFVLSFCFIRNYRSGDEGVGERINAATEIITESRSEQQSITAGVEGTAKQADAIRATINQSNKQAIRVEGEVRATGEAISECRKSIERCQQLITTIKARAEPHAE